MGWRSQNWIPILPYMLIWVELPLWLRGVLLHLYSLNDRKIMYLLLAIKCRSKLESIWSTLMARVLYAWQEDPSELSASSSRDIELLCKISELCCVQSRWPKTIAIERRDRKGSYLAVMVHLFWADGMAGGSVPHQSFRHEEIVHLPFVRSGGTDRRKYHSLAGHT